ncbi:hypothetical protein BJX99DRAFT_54140 [Aspergillus californicus]
MSVLNMGKRSCESLSSTFSYLELSLSRDSCYASDDMSVPSTKPVTTEPVTRPSLASSAETSSHTFPKSILKRPYSEIEEDEESESGYASDCSEYNYDRIFEEADSGLCDLINWDDDTSDVMSDLCIDDVESFDGSFISFEATVRFDSNVRYIEPPTYEDDECAGIGMTCHELMKMTRTSSYPNKSHEETYSGAETSDIVDADHEDISDSIEQLPEHTSDIIQLDKTIFEAYMNGVNEIANPEYKLRLRARVADFKSGFVPSPFLEMDSANGMYLNTVLRHVIGTFRNIVTKDELNALVDLSGKAHACQEIGANVFDEIEHLLSRRLTGKIAIGPDELSFFASGVAFILENRKSYASI